MGKHGSKLSKPTMNAHNNKQYDYKSAVDQFNELSQQTEYYVEQGELEEAFHRHRACAFIMIKVHQNCPESYKTYAESAVKKVTLKMKEIKEHLQSVHQATQEDTRDTPTYLIGHDQVRDKIIKLLNMNQLVMHGLRIHDTTIFFYGSAKSIAKAMGLNIMVVKCQDIYNKYIEESERCLGKLFEEASQSKTCLVF